jgi:hypothetical protein
MLSRLACSLSVCWPATIRTCVIVATAERTRSLRR